VLGGDGNDTLTGSAAINVFIDAGTGDDQVSGSKSGGGTVTLYGGDGNDTLSGSGTNSGITLDGGAGDDLLFVGGLRTGIQVSGGAGQDTIVASSGMATVTGGDDSDLFIVKAREVLGDTMVRVNDFITGLDHLGVSQSSLAVGNGDLQVDGAVSTNGPGGFDSSAELVIVTADIAGSLTLDKAAAAIGSANQAYAAGQTVVFVVDNGFDSWALYFQSAGADATVSAAELAIIGRLGWTGTGPIGVDDVVWTA
jgi:Ca2+-binding RTX toxin-like protein